MSTWVALYHEWIKAVISDCRHVMVWRSTHLAGEPEITWVILHSYDVKPAWWVRGTNLETAVVGYIGFSLIPAFRSWIIIQIPLYSIEYGIVKFMVFISRLLNTDHDDCGNSFICKRRPWCSRSSIEQTCPQSCCTRYPTLLTLAETKTNPKREFQRVIFNPYSVFCRLEEARYFNPGKPAETMSNRSLPHNVLY